MRGETYDEFVDKFKPKKTTDDCYTPPLVYDAVKCWACKEYSIDPETIVRPFYPGGDYEHFYYPEGCTVLDNPPFSILAKICSFYLDKGIRFFLFSPALTAFNGKKVFSRMNHIICDADVVYENGAVVQTAFVTNLSGDIVAQTAPDLGELIKGAVKKSRNKNHLPKYEYPDNVLTAAMLGRYSKHGIKWKIKKESCMLISKLDAQEKLGKAIYGGGLLLSDKEAENKRRAESLVRERRAESLVRERRAESLVREENDVYRFELSERERKIISQITATADK